MGRELNHAEVRDLLGAFALDAVDDDEAQAVEQHLEGCQPCRAEVAEHREVAALMAAGWVPAPDGVWDRIASSLEETPPSMRLGNMPVGRDLPLGDLPLGNVAQLDTARERRSRRILAGPIRAIAAVGVAAAVAAVAFLGFRVVDTGRQVDELTQQLASGDLGRAADAAARSPEARKVSLTSGDGHLTADAVLLEDGTGYLVRSNLPPLPADRTYQLWAVVGTSKISVGVLGSRPSAAAFHVHGDVSALAITQELAGGVVVSQQAPTVVGTVA